MSVPAVRCPFAYAARFLPRSDAQDKNDKAWLFVGNNKNPSLMSYACAVLHIHDAGHI